MRRAMLALESVVALPVFYLSWLGCAVYYAAIAGRNVARASGDEKRAALDAMFKRES